MKFMIDSLILWPSDSENNIQEIFFEKNKVNIIHGISGTGKSSIISIIDYCLGSSKCAIPVGIIRESVAWFGIKVNIKGHERLIARRTPDNKSVSKEFYLSTYSDEIPSELTATDNLVTFKKKFNQLVQLSDLHQSDDDKNPGFDSRASYRDMAAFNFLPQHIVANPYTLFFKADSYQNKEKLQRVMPFALGIIDREYMVKEKERSDLEKRLNILNKQLEIHRNALSNWELEIEILWQECIELGLISNLENIDTQEKINNLKFINKKYLDGKILDVLKKTNYEHHNSLINDLILQGEEKKRSIDDLKTQIINYEQLLSKGKEFTNAIKREQKRTVGFEWLKETLAPNHECIACGSKTESLHVVIDNLEKKVNSINSLSDALFDNPIEDRELNNFKIQLRNLQSDLHSIRIKKISLENMDKENTDSLNNIYIVIGKIQEKLLSIEKISNNNHISEQMKKINKELTPLKKYFENKNFDNDEYTTYLTINNLIEKYADKFNLKRSGEIKFDKKELTLSFFHPTLKKYEYLWEIGSGANWMGYHISTFLAFHEYFSKEENQKLPPFSFLVIDQPSQVYFPSAESGDNILDDANKMKIIQNTRENDISATKKIFEVLAHAIQENNYNFQIIVLEHADRTIWGDVKNIHESARWKYENDGLIPLEWIK
ncbi:DUF3732 domain-containing protein [Providencia sp. PROV189]|uniref:DUF3732 domain-containing protein n=1 Tax=Providencia sp. PROV189 TaxID=2949890 RepID=UPI00234B171F|nr:DUF3732 domain-containing protein [Providencia sp. PROV189]